MVPCSQIKLESSDSVYTISRRIEKYNVGIYKKYTKSAIEHAKAYCERLRKKEKILKDAAENKL